MAELWYYTNEGVQMDAAPLKELKRLVDAGTLKPTDMVWQDGMPRWIRASSVTDLFPDPVTALDHYFTNTAGKTTTTAETSAPHTSVKPANVPTSPATTSDEKSATKTSSDGEESERRKPPRRRTEPASSSGGMNWGILIAIFLGAGVLLTGLVVGVVILIVVSRSPDDGGKDGIAAKKDAIAKDGPKADGGKAIPNLDKIKQNPGGNIPKIVGQTEYTVSVAPQQANGREFIFEAGANYEIVVKSQPRQPDVDLYVMNPANNVVEVSDDSIGPDSLVRWSPNRPGPFRVEVRNLNGVTRVQSKVTIRMVTPPPNRDKQEEKKDDKNDPQTDPLPPDTFEKSGGKQITSLPAGKEVSFKFRVKVGYKASFSMTTTMAFNPKVGLIVVKESDNSVLAEDKGAGANPRVLLELPRTEIVRVRIINNGKTSISGTLLYEVSP